MIEFTFNQPRYIFFLFSLAGLVVLHYITLQYARGRALQFANFAAIARVTTPITLPRNTLQLVLRLFTLAAIVFAVTGLQVHYESEGSRVDYVIAVDSSSSMSATDILPNRLDAAKQAATKFIFDLPKDAMVGVVSFAGTSFIQQLPIADKELVRDAIDRIQINPAGGTDVGDAIVTSANLLVTRTAPKRIILITDGQSNVGIALQRAIDYAKENQIQVYTIGVGRTEHISAEPISDLNEDSLTAIAAQTNATYTWANTKEELDKSYGGIIRVENIKKTVDLTTTLLFLVFILSFADWALLNTVYRRIP